VNQSQPKSAAAEFDTGSDRGFDPGFDPGREVVIKRVLSAPRELVFKVWTDPEHLARWWGPHGFTNPRCETDARPGGQIPIDMRGPDGTVYPMAGEFKEVTPPERLVFTSSALDADGQPLFENLNIVTFDDEGGKTAVTVRARAVTWTAVGVQYLKGMEMGWAQTIERFAAYAERTEQ
jgi:uncharacterized protein YndB with AHSA1/START domain